MSSKEGKEIIKSVMESPFYQGMPVAERRTLIYRLLAVYHKSATGTQSR